MARLNPHLPGQPGIFEATHLELLAQPIQQRLGYLRHRGKALHMGGQRIALRWRLLIPALAIGDQRTVLVEVIRHFDIRALLAVKHVWVLRFCRMQVLREFSARTHPNR